MSILSYWFIAGIALLIAEMTTGTFVLFFISLGCFAAALVEVFSQGSLILEFLTGSLVSVLGVFIFRKRFLIKILKNSYLATDIGKEIAISTTLPPHQKSQITYQGTPWTAINLDSEEIQQGEKVSIVGIDGNTLLIRKLN